MIFLLGRHAMFGHEPPTYLRSTTTTRCPFSAEVQAISLPPAPLPRTTRSYSSGLVLWIVMLASFQLCVGLKPGQAYRILRSVRPFYHWLGSIPSPHAPREFRRIERREPVLLCKRRQPLYLRWLAAE